MMFRWAMLHRIAFSVISSGPGGRLGRPPFHFLFWAELAVFCEFERGGKFFAK
jgi:hypothetical protein